MVLEKSDQEWVKMQNEHWSGLDKTPRLEGLQVGVWFLYEPIIYKRQDELQSNLTKLIKHKGRVKLLVKF